MRTDVKRSVYLLQATFALSLMAVLVCSLFSKVPVDVDGACTEPAKCTVDIVWMAQDLLEESWVHEHMLKGCSVKKHFNDIPENPTNVLFVVNRGSVGRLIKLPRFSELTNVGLIHLSDEAGLDNVSFYSQFDYVFRNYWFQQVQPYSMRLSR